MTALDHEHDEPRGIRPGTIAGGAILLTLGALMLADPTGALRLHSNRLVAPLLLLAFGVASLINATGDRAGGWSERRGRRRRMRGSGGVWLIGVGAWMLLSEMHLFGLDYRTSWPLFIVMWGVLMVVRGMR